mmetsp:Transcript_6374/g.19764  ORF Transcript_6374/g.19764 Transcript_6374/m.19764 type:complete len:236 (-) Transcript_6374:303-1010(-)
MLPAQEQLEHTSVYPQFRQAITRGCKAQFQLFVDDACVRMAQCSWPVDCRPATSPGLRCPLPPRPATLVLPHPHPGPRPNLPSLALAPIPVLMPFFPRPRPARPHLRPCPYTPLAPVLTHIPASVQRQWRDEAAPPHRAHGQQRVGRRTAAEPAALLHARVPVGRDGRCAGGRRGQWAARRMARRAVHAAGSCALVQCNHGAVQAAAAAGEADYARLTAHGCTQTQTRGEGGGAL